MAQQDPVTIVGSPLDAWLTAVMLARFAPLAGAKLQVLETSPVARVDDVVVLRPEMVRTNVSIGLDPKRLGAQPGQAWAGPHRQSLPFNSFGRPLKGVSFVAIWLRAREELGETRSLQSFVSAGQTGGCAIEVGRYVQALKTIATKVGVTPCTQASEHIVQADPNLTEAQPDCSVGAAVMTLRPSTTLRLQAVHKSVLALIDCWSWRENDRDLAAREYDRRLQAMQASIEDMQALLWSDGRTDDYSSRLKHRVSVWQNVGRIAPVDDDQFTPQEWMAAFLSAELVPSAAGRLVHSLTLAEISDHVETCSPKEVANV